VRISLKWPRQSARNGHPGSGFWPPPRRPRQRPTRGVRVIPWSSPPLDAWRGWWPG